MPHAIKRPTKSAAKKQTTKAPAGRHHSDSPHPKEFDIDLDFLGADKELKFLLSLLRPLLQQVIEGSRRCEQHHKVRSHYTNITFCSH